MRYEEIRRMFADARKKRMALGAFNILNDLTARSIVRAAQDMALPVILQTSVSTVKEIWPGAADTDAEKPAGRRRDTVLIHLDHCADPALAKECIDAGWDSVMIDASRQPLDENIRITRDIREYAGKKRRFCGGRGRTDTGGGGRRCHGHKRAGQPC